MRTAPRSPGIYYLYLDGVLMKVGKAAYRDGIRWRLQQYWRGNKTAGMFREAITTNRGNITVVWQTMDPGMCRQAELAGQLNAGGVRNLGWCYNR